MYALHDLFVFLFFFFVCIYFIYNFRFLKCMRSLIVDMIMHPQHVLSKVALYISHLKYFFFKYMFFSDFDWIA